MFVFDDSPSPDVVGYSCHTWERHPVEVEPTPLCPAPCMGMSQPREIPCVVLPSSVGGYTWESRVGEIPAGAVIYGCVRAWDPSGNGSVCIGWSEP